MEKAVFKISGMKCGSCAKLIKYGLEEEKGIKNVDVDFDSAKAFLEFDPLETNPSKIESKIKELGYKTIKE